MARYKPIDTRPRFLLVDLQRQLLPGTFEYALNHLIDHELELSRFDAHFKNDVTGAAAYPPGMLLKVVLFAYSQGIISSRAIEAVCREHVTFVALSGDPRPHFTTIAAFVSRLGDDIAAVFAQVLYLCDRQGLIGREMFAIDGVKLPSNASKHKSGTRADFEHQATKLEAAAQAMLKRHREADRQPVEASLTQKESQRLQRLQSDAGYHSEANLKQLAQQKITALIADNGMRGRDERLNDQARHKTKPDPLYDKSPLKDKTKASKSYRPADFNYNRAAGTCICPAGKSLYQNGAHCTINGRIFTKFSGTLRDCVPCKQRADCLRTSEKTQVRQVAFYQGPADKTEESYTDQMKRAIDSAEGRARYGQRFATVEPVFGNLRHNKQLNRFTLRGQKKVDAQWKLYCLVHNIEKLAHHGYGR